MLRDDEFADIVEIAEDELIEDYIGNSLTAQDAQAFSARLKGSAELRQRFSLISGIIKIAASGDPLPAKQQVAKSNWFSNLFFSLRFAAVAAAVVLVGVAIWRIGFVSNEADGLADLRAATTGQRLTVGRSTLNAGYAPVIATRGARTAVDQSTPEFKKAKAAILTSESKDPQDPHTLHLLGLVYLAEGNLDNAIAEMQKAEKIEPENARLLSDLAAVFLEKSLANADAGRDRAIALEYAENAVKTDPTLLEPLFNRALILQEMSLPIEAKKAWQEYLAKDPDSEWAAEARKKLEMLERSSDLFRKADQTVADLFRAYDSRDPERAWQIVSESKELITDSVVFFSIAHEMVKRNGSGLDRKRALDGLKFIAEIESAKTNDSFFVELYDHYKGLPEERYDEAHQANLDADAGYKVLNSDPKAAAEAFERAKNVYLSIGNLWEADIAEFQLCYTLTQTRKIAESSEKLNAIAAKSRAQKHTWVASIADGWIASNHSLSGEYSSAIAFNRRSLEGAKAISDTYGLQKASGQLTNQYLKLGNEQKALEAIESIWSAPVSYFQSPRQSSRNLLFASLAFHRFGYLAAADAYAREQLSLSRDVLKDEWLTHSAHMNAARVLASRGDFDRALEHARESVHLAEIQKDASLRGRLSVQSALLLADVYRGSGNFDEAIANYDRVINEYSVAEFVTSLYQARRGRLLCLAESGRDEEFSVEMNEVTALLDKNRQSIEDESDRNIFFEGEQSVYDVAAEHAFARSNSDLAFAYAERSRANYLAGQIPGGVAEPDLNELRSRLADDISIVYYAVLPKKTLVWTIEKNASQVVSVDISATDLAKLVEEFSKSIEKKNASVDVSARLYDLLVAPVSDKWKDKRAICIITDRSLLNLSFAALRSGTSGKYLIEDIAVMYSPSLRVFDRLSAISVEKDARPSDGSFVGVGAAAFDKQTNPGLANIDGVLQEVSDISKFYPSGSVYKGEQATAKILKDSWQASGTFHFAGHYVTNKTTPSQSKFLVADGSVTVAEIFEKSSAAPNLVVLSACESGIERYYAGEGMIGASRAFLAAGVPLVIGSRWAVDSEATRELMTAFHRLNTQPGTNASQALRAAQIEILTNQEMYKEPYYWAGFMPIGGYSEG